MENRRTRTSNLLNNNFFQVVVLNLFGMIDRCLTGYQNFKKDEGLVIYDDQHMS